MKESSNRVLPISSGSNKQYKGKRRKRAGLYAEGPLQDQCEDIGMEEISSRIALLSQLLQRRCGDSWKSVGAGNEPQSHGCIRIPMSAAVEVAGCCRSERLSSFMTSSRLSPRRTGPKQTSKSWKRRQPRHLTRPATSGRYGGVEYNRVFQ